MWHACFNHLFSDQYDIGIFSLTIGSFTDLGGDVWGITENGFDYEFAESNGILSVVAIAIPEPSSTALFGLGGLGMLTLIRRRK